MDRNLKVSCSFFWPSQNIVRVWEAMLRFKAATRFVIPVQIAAAMLRNLHTCVDNPLGVCGFVRTEPPGLKPREDDGRDEHADLDARALGAFRGVHDRSHRVARYTESANLVRTPENTSGSCN